MFFRKRREAAKAAAVTAQMQILDSFQAQMDTANAIPDVEERLAKLDDLRETMTQTVSQAEQLIKGKYVDKLVLPYFGIGGGAVVATGAIVGALAFPPAVMLLAIFPGAALGFWAGNKRAENWTKNALQELQPFFDAINEKKEAATHDIDALINAKIRTLASSPQFDALQARPGLRDSFMKALKRQVTGQSDPTPPKRPDGGSLKL